MTEKVIKAVIEKHDPPKKRKKLPTQRMAEAKGLLDELKRVAGNKSKVEEIVAKSEKILTEK